MEFRIRLKWPGDRIRTPQEAFTLNGFQDRRFDRSAISRLRAVDPCRKVRADQDSTRGIYRLFFSDPLGAIVNLSLVH